MPMKTPDITPMQILAAVGAIVGVLLTATVIDGRTAQVITGIAAVIVPFAFTIADAIIRHGRAQVAAATVAAGIVPEAVVPKPRTHRRHRKETAT